MWGEIGEKGTKTRPHCGLQLPTGPKYYGIKTSDRKGTQVDPENCM